MLEYLIWTFQCKWLFHISKCLTPSVRVLQETPGLHRSHIVLCFICYTQQYIQNGERGTAEARREFLQAFTKHSDHLTIYPVRSCVHMFSLRFSSSRILFFCWSLISFPCLSHSYSSQCILFTTQRGEPIANLWSGCCKAKINGSGGMTWVYRTLRWLTPSPSLICTFCCCTWRAA